MALLSIGTWHSKCLACNRDADPYEEAHDTLLGYSVQPGDKGCGEKFTAVTTPYPHLEERVKQMRPDLPFETDAD